VLEEARCASESDVVAAATNTDVLFVQFAKVTRKALARLNDNALVIRYGIGLDNLDLVAARELGIKVVYVPDYATGEVADHTAALVLTALRKIFPLDRSVREGRWDPVGVARPIRGFAESTVGFVGFGRIGREVHARLQPFGFSSIVADPFVDLGKLAALNAQSVDLDTLFSTADAITLHAPLTPETRHVVDARRLGQMKSSAVVVNTARGGLIDAAALEEALRAKRIGGAALDVFEHEPLTANSGLRDLTNVILTPHAAWYSTRSAEQLQALAADELDRHLSGKPPRCLAPAAA
jgi:D-3-phosphoglycerate dehydrogenase